MSVRFSGLPKFAAITLMLLVLQACAAFKRPPLPDAPPVQRDSPDNELAKVVYSRHFTERFLPGLSDDERLAMIRGQAETLAKLFCANEPIIHQEAETSEIIGLGEQQWYRNYKLVECDIDFEALAEAKRSNEWRAVLYAGKEDAIADADVGGDLYEFGFTDDAGRVKLVAATSIQSGNFFDPKTRYIQEVLKQ